MDLRTRLDKAFRRLPLEKQQEITRILAAYKPEQDEVSGEYAYHMGRSEYECVAFGPGKPPAPLFGDLPIYEQAKWIFIAGRKAAAN